MREVQPRDMGRLLSEHAEFVQDMEASEKPEPAIFLSSLEPV